MYSDAFCTVYNLFGWNYFPEAFGEQLLQWLDRKNLSVKNSLDIGCGTGVLCEILHKSGVRASGMDLSEGMIAIARENNPDIHYEVANMISYRPDAQFDLVTCTGDALNHIISLNDIETIFNNVFSYMSPGGYFIFDVLNEKEISTDEPIDLDFSETTKAQFRMTRNDAGMVNLCVTVWENGVYQFEENITETVHDPEVICALLKKCGFELVRCAHTLLDDAPAQATTWFIIAEKPV